MAELKFEAPLAQFEETDEWGPVDYQTATSNLSMKSAISDTLNLNLKENDNQSILILEEAIKDNCIGMMEDISGGGGGVHSKGSPNCNSTPLCMANAVSNGQFNGKENSDNFTEAFSGSLEDLVNTFDEKITKCFGNYEQSVEEMAPVQVRSQEEIMNECQ